MLRWFKKQRVDAYSPDLRVLTERLIGPRAQAAAIAECVREYVGAVQVREVEYPAHRRKSASVLELWQDVRLEALHRMFNFGQADLMSLADIRQQLPLLTSFLDDRPHLQMPQPRGEPIADTIQVIWQVYVYLSTVGGELADSATVSHVLKKRGRDILSDFTEKASTLRARWQAFDRAMKGKDQMLPDMPETIIAILWADVTIKTKSIAMSKVFGPMHESGMRNLLEIVSKKSPKEEVKELEALFARLKVATDPGDIRAP